MLGALPIGPFFTVQVIRFLCPHSLLFLMVICAVHVHILSLVSQVLSKLLGEGGGSKEAIMKPIINSKGSIYREIATGENF